MAKYKTVFTPKLGGEGVFEKEFDTLREASLALDAISAYTLMLHECSLMQDHSNAGWIERLDEDGEWIEVDLNDPDEELVEKCRELFLDGMRVDAVRLVKKNKDLGLKDSLDWCRNNVSEWGESEL